MFFKFIFSVIFSFVAFGSGLVHAHRFQNIVAGDFHTCAITEDSELMCFGNNDNDQCNQGHITKPITFIAAAERGTCAIDKGYNLNCFGNRDIIAHDWPRETMANVFKVSMGWGNTCLQKVNGSIECMGISGWHEENRLRGLSDIVMGATTTCAIDRRTSHGYCFGCYIPNVSSYYEEEMCPPRELGPVKQIATRGYHTCIIKADSHVDCFGGPFRGNTLKPPHDLGEVKAIAVGSHFACAIKMDDHLRCWAGIHDNGGGNNPRNLGKVISITAGNSHACAILEQNRNIRCWGNNDRGQLNGIPQ